MASPFHLNINPIHYILTLEISLKIEYQVICGSFWKMALNHMESTINKVIIIIIIIGWNSVQLINLILLPCQENIRNSDYANSNPYSIFLGILELFQTNLIAWQLNRIFSLTFILLLLQVKLKWKSESTVNLNLKCCLTMASGSNSVVDNSLKVIVVPEKQVLSKFLT